MISCLTITQTGHLDLLATAVADFTRQTFPDRELLVVHDGGPELHADIERLLAPHQAAGQNIRLLAGQPGSSLGVLRNLSLDAARGDFICQWDDDDRYHPLRLELQWQKMTEDKADFCFLCDQLHWFHDSGTLFWDDWYPDSWPINVIQGTLLGRRELMPRYPDAKRGEDTSALIGILRARHRIARLRHAGWCYLYSYHGSNAWEASHHQAIAQAKGLHWSRLTGRKAVLEQRLAEYQPPLPPLKMQCANEIWQF